MTSRTSHRLGRWSALHLTTLLSAAALSLACEGPAGPAGIDGDDGSNGVDGNNGNDGTDGDDGSNGTRGSDGEDGEEGSPGEDGDDGETGAQGLQGAQGVQGTQGVQGIQGVQGVQGAQGLQGSDGEDGRDGRDALGGASTSLTLGEPFRVSLSLTGHDRFFGVTYDAEGNIYAVGQVSTGIANGDDFAFVVAKFLASGDLDASFGNDGVAIKNVAVGGSSLENARGVVVQSSGKVVIAGTVEHDVGASAPFNTDTDIALVRFNADGSLDTTFGTDGVAQHDLSTGTPNNPSTPTSIDGEDTQWSLSLAQGDKLVVHGTMRDESGDGDPGTTRHDTDWALVRLTADGALDTTFSGDGIVSLDIGGANASARAATVLTDDSIIGVGYTTSTVLGVSAQQPVLYKVTSSGVFDATFATTDFWTEDGVWHDFASPDDGLGGHKNAEAYGAALQGTHLVTMGYGPTYGSGSSTDWVSFRFDENGDQDFSYGNASVSVDDGACYLDPNGWGDNGRFVLVLGDNRVMGLGRGSRAGASQPERDGMVAILSEDGVPDTSFGTGGHKLYDMGGDGDHFWGGALSPNKTRVAIVGVIGAETSINDDDAVLLILPVN